VGIDSILLNGLSVDAVSTTTDSSNTMIRVFIFVTFLKTGVEINLPLELIT
jgi:hypothetical protein